MLSRYLGNVYEICLLGVLEEFQSLLGIPLVQCIDNLEVQISNAGVKEQQSLVLCNVVILFAISCLLAGGFFT